MTGKQIYNLIPKLAAAVGAVGKDKTNKQQGFAYRSVDALYNRIGPCLAELGITTTSEVVTFNAEALDRKGQRIRVHMRYKLIAPDESFITWEAVGEAADSYDKATNKAMSAAYKYAFFQGLSIPLDIDQTPPPMDGDANTPDCTPAPTATREPAYSPPQRFGPDMKAAATNSERRDILASAYAAQLEGRYDESKFNQLCQFAVTEGLLEADVVDVMQQVKKLKADDGEVFTDPRS